MIFGRGHKHGGAAGGWDRFVAIAVMLALTLLGLAHATPHALERASTPPPQVAEIDLAAYTLPDGSGPEICFGAAGDAHGPTACDVCVLVGAGALLPPCVAAPTPRSALTRAPLTSQAAPPSLRRAWAAQPRAPPAV